MQFKQYPSYKNSGVEWLGEVPEGWQVIPSKFYFIERKEKAENTDKQLTASQKLGIIFQEDFMAENGRVMVVMKNPEILKKVRPNDFVISMRSFQGGLELSYLEGSISSAYVMLKPNLNVVNIEYFKYLFKTTRYIQSLQSTSNLIRDGQALRFNNFSQVKLVLPSKSDQQKIVSFLDTETARIDNLINKQQKLIELLEEQRKSIISYAVTKGLNPNVPMKDSGVEWLGEVPESWHVAVVKRAFIVKLGKMLQPDQKDETDVFKKYLKASNITWDGVKDIDNEMWFSENELKKLKLEIGDLLVAEGGDVGKSCIFDSSEEFYYQNSINRVRGQKNNANKFLYYWLFTLKYSGYIDILCNKSTIAHFTAEKLNETILLLPDGVEQNEIIAYLDRENEKINHFVLKQNHLIEKLKEYRSSIISHAVTGKIDVREWGA
ncbi:MAG: restriction endonuclease subunit S [Pseudomonadales bacterium]|nr:restriction endonuclease subunit S [Pseudomonadales bacterium]